MRRHRSLRALARPLLLLLFPVAASAQDFGAEDDFVFDDAPAQPAPDRLEDADDLDLDDSELDDLEIPDTDDGVDLFGDEPTRPAGPGDTADLYRQRQAQFARLPADEEVEAWERYLAEFPGSAFRARIEQRIDELMDSIYRQRVVRGGGDVDALQQEVKLAQGLLIENIDPRSRLRVGVELGLPTWLNPFVDYEHALMRTLSAHVAVRRRFTGMSIEPGVKYAIVKSTRTNTLVTALADLHINAGPTAFLGVRPMLAAGKRFGDSLDVQAQGGVELELRQTTGVRILGGFNATYRASEIVGLYLEASAHFKNIGGAAGPGAFNVASIGMKFFPSRKGDGVNENVQLDVGASVPFATNYYAFHYGSIVTQANLFLD